MTVSDILDQFLFSKKLAGLSPATITDYSAHLKGFISYAGGSLPISGISERLVQDYILSLYSRPLKKASVATYVRNLRIFLTYIHKTSPLPFSPDSIKVPKNPKKQLQIYSDDEIQKIFQAVPSSVLWLKSRNQAIIALMLDSGLRQGEISSLRLADVSFRPPRLLVHGKGNKDRFVPLGNVSAGFLHEYFNLCPFPIKDFVFLSDCGDPLSCNAIRLFVSRIAKRLPFALSSHKLRHNFATNYCLDKIESTGQVDAYTLKTLMGHENISTTERYIHCAVELLAAKSSISHLDKIFQSSP